MEKEDLLHKYLNGEASPEDVKRLQEDSAYAEYLDIADASAEFITPDFRSEHNFEAIQQRLSTTSSNTKSKNGRTWLRIAAALVVLLCGYWFFSSRSSLKETEVAQKITFSLPDASQVVLNAASQVRYQEKNWENDRSLQLKGEAYFKVAKGKKFSVQTTEGEISVLGTEFNVFVRDGILEVRCYEGRVSVSFDSEASLDETIEHDGQHIFLPAGKGIRIQNGQTIRSLEIKRTAPSWTGNESSFENASIPEVLDELKRQYPIDIKLTTTVNRKFSGSFGHQNLEVALQSICDPLQLTFTLQDDEVTLYAKPNK